MDSTPTVSIVLPARDARAYITDCLVSLLEQDYDAITEIIVVDRGSVDGTRELAAARGTSVRVVECPNDSVATAFHAGIDAARGDVICRADVRARYQPDYVSQCVATLVASGARRVEAQERAVGSTSFGRAVAAVRLAGDYSGRDGMEWAEKLAPAVGAALVEAPGRSARIAEPDAGALARRAFADGVRAGARWRTRRKAVPSAMVGPAMLVATSVVMRRSRRRGFQVVVPVVHAGVCAARAWRASDDPGVAPLRAFIALEISDWVAGVGFWVGLARGAQDALG